MRHLRSGELIAPVPVWVLAQPGGSSNARLPATTNTRLVAQPGAAAGVGPLGGARANAGKTKRAGINAAALKGGPLLQACAREGYVYDEYRRVLMEALAPQLTAVSKPAGRRDGGGGGLVQQLVRVLATRARFDAGLAVVLGERDRRQQGAACPDLGAM